MVEIYPAAIDERVAVADQGPGKPLRLRPVGETLVQHFPVNPHVVPGRSANTELKDLDEAHRGIVAFQSRKDLGGPKTSALPLPADVPALVWVELSVERGPHRAWACARSPWAVPDGLGNVVWGERLGEEVPLGLIAAEFAQALELVFCFDAFGD